MAPKWNRVGHVDAVERVEHRRHARAVVADADRRCRRRRRRRTPASRRGRSPITPGRPASPAARPGARARAGSRRQPARSRAWRPAAIDALQAGLVVAGGPSRGEAPEHVGRTDDVAGVGEPGAHGPDVRTDAEDLLDQQDRRAGPGLRHPHGIAMAPSSPTATCSSRWSSPSRCVAHRRRSVPCPACASTTSTTRCRRRASPRSRSNPATPPGCSSTGGARRPSTARSPTSPELLARRRRRGRQRDQGDPGPAAVAPGQRGRGRGPPARTARVPTAGRGRRSSGRPASCGGRGAAGRRRRPVIERRRPHRGRGHVRREAGRCEDPLDELDEPVRCRCRRTSTRRSASPSATRPSTPRARVGGGADGRAAPDPELFARIAAAGRRRRARRAGRRARHVPTGDRGRSARPPDAQRALSGARGDVGGVPGRRAASSPSARPACGRWRARRRRAELEGRTELFLHAGSTFQVVDVLMTNFHLPRTTLLMMIDAFVGPRWRRLYATRAGRGLPLPVVR